MTIEHLQALEEKIGQLINRLVKLKDENKELLQANRKLEEKVQELGKEIDKHKEENKQLQDKLQKAGTTQAQDEQIRGKLEDLLGKINEVVQA